MVFNHFSFLFSLFSASFPSPSPLHHWYMQSAEIRNKVSFEVGVSYSIAYKNTTNWLKELWNQFNFILLTRLFCPFTFCVLLHCIAAYCLCPASLVSWHYPLTKRAGTWNISSLNPVRLLPHRETRNMTSKWMFLFFSSLYKSLLGRPCWFWAGSSEFFFFKWEHWIPNIRAQPAPFMEKRHLLICYPTAKMDSFLCGTSGGHRTGWKPVSGPIIQECSRKNTGGSIRCRMHGKPAGLHIWPTRTRQQLAFRVVGSGRWFWPESGGGGV